MKPAIAPIVINQRLVRLFAWAGLWFVWAGAFLSGVRCGFRKSRKLEAPRRSIALMTRLVIAILLIRATHFVTHIQRRQRAYGPNAYRGGGRRRADIGVAIRKALRAPTLLGRIAKLSDALRNPEKLARAIAARITRNLTKRVRLYAPAFIVAALSTPFALSEPTLDSS
jgi:hypothetical protein